MIKNNNSFFKSSIGGFMLTSSIFIGGCHYSNATNLITHQKNYDKDLPKPIFQNSLGTFYEDLSGAYVSVDYFNNQLVKWFGLNENHSFEKTREFIDEIGYKHQTFQHVYKGVKVENDLVFVHSKGENVQSVNGQLLVFNDIDLSYNLSDETVLEIALNDFENINVQKIKTELLISKISNKSGVDIVLSKKLQLISIKPMKNIYYYIDSSGKIVKTINGINNADVQGSGLTYYNGIQNFTVDSFNGQYRLYDNARKISTLNAIDITQTPYFNESTQTYQLVGGQEYLSSTTSFTSVNTKPAIGVHWAMSKTYDYYMNIHNRNSYDGLGANILNYYNYPSDFGDTGNASALDAGFFVGMFFGSGNDLLNPVVAIDVAGHEFSHLVISRNGNGGLDYEGESGALNESFADIFGASIEFYANANPNWTIGEGIIKDFITPSYFRNMANPNDAPAALGFQQPDTYNGNYWVDPNDFFNDYGGVHINSGVGNFWFYLLSDLNVNTGINDINNQYYVEGIGINKAEKIAYKALMEGLTPSATYLDAYNATRQAAIALYGLNSNEYNQVVNAWYAVGIGDSPANIDFNEFKVNFSVYPNPTKEGIFSIESQLDDLVVVQVYDLLGKKVTENSNIQKGTNQMNISNLSNGVYNLVFKSKGKVHSVKLIKN